MFFAQPVADCTRLCDPSTLQPARHAPCSFGAAAATERLKCWMLRNIVGARRFRPRPLEDGAGTSKRIPHLSVPHLGRHLYRIIQDPGAIWVEHVKLVACPHARYSLSWAEAEPVHPSKAPGPPNNRETHHASQLPNHKWKCRTRSKQQAGSNRK